MKYLFLLLFIIGPGFGAEQKNDPINFFVKEHEKKSSKWQFNEYENIVSGGIAFLIGNIGYMSTDSAVLGLTYSAIQTLGIINVGQGIYKMNSPSMDGSFKQLLTNPKVEGYTKKELAAHILNITAKEKRAKRLSIFYSSSLLTVQYFANATLYDSPGKLGNIYIFLGGVNALVSVYTAFFKNSYEEFIFGEGIDLNPFAAKKDGNDLFGLNLNVKF